MGMRHGNHVRFRAERAFRHEGIDEDTF
jgi:hypothetical protein